MRTFRLATLRERRQFSCDTVRLNSPPLLKATHEREKITCFFMFQRCVFVGLQFFVRLQCSYVDLFLIYYLSDLSCNKREPMQKKKMLRSC